MKSSPIRVLAFLEAHSITGPAKVIVELARESVRPDNWSSRLEITIATFLRGEQENSFTRAILAEGIPLEIIRERFAFDPAVIPQIRSILSRRQPDILWTHAVKSHFLTRLTGLYKRTHWVASHHGYTTTDWKTRAYNELDRWSHRGAERVITVCRKFAGDLETRGIQADRIRVQHNPVRLPGLVDAETRREFRRNCAIDDDTRVLVSVGRLSLEKGHAELIRAIAEVYAWLDRPVRLVLVGDGPERSRLEALSRTLGISDSVTFAGQQADVRPYYAMADLFVLPSHSEGSPNVLLEAMAFDIPVVATAVGGVPEIVTDDESALLVPPRNPKAMAAAIVRLLDDRDLQTRLTSTAREALKQHTPEIYFAELWAIFQEVAQS